MSAIEAEQLRREIAQRASDLYALWVEAANLDSDEATALWYTEFEKIPRLQLASKLNIYGMNPERRVIRIYKRAINKIRKWHQSQS